jgi:MATE family multidrug resistance protein
MRDAPSDPIARHLRQTILISLPIGAALLSEVGMGLISTVMLGGLGPQALAAGALGINVFITFLLVLQGLLTGVGVLAANWIGAGRTEEVPELYWSGVALAVLLTLPLFALLSAPAGLWRLVGAADALSADLAFYLHILRWAVPAGVVGIGMMRQFLPAIGLERMLLYVLPAGVVVHAGASQILIRGAFGFAGFGFAGSAAAVVVTLSLVAASMLALLHGPRFAHFVRFAPPRRATIVRLLHIGLPVAGIVVVEAGLFLVTGFLAARLGPGVVAAHMIALNVASLSFTVPLAISQAANVRVATAHGAGLALQARRAGFAAIMISMSFMGCAALFFSFAPHLIVHAYLPETAANAATAAIAVNLLRVAGVFQLADGTQVTASGALRGLQDVRVPMLLASFGYWGIGFWAGWFLAFRAGLGAVGLWWGLCAGLAVVAVSLTWRFERRSRPVLF